MSLVSVTEVCKCEGVMQVEGSNDDVQWLLQQWRGQHKCVPDPIPFPSWGSGDTYVFSNAYPTE